MAGLFDPLQIGSLTLRNRFVMAPMTRCRAHNGVPTAEMGAYYRRRAAGGLGLIITEGTLIDHPLANAYGDAPYLRADTVKGWREVNDAIRSEGCYSFVQIWHCGPEARPGVAAFSLEEGGKEVVHTATPTEERELLECYRAAAGYAVEAGFDGLELHGAHGYLLDSFLRAGKRGFVEQVVAVTRETVGPGFPIVLRFSNWTLRDYDACYVHTPTELQELLAPLQAAGVDLFHPSTRRYWEPAFAGSDLTLAAWTRRLSGLPTIAVGSFGLETVKLTGDGPESLGAVQQDLSSGDFDLVAVGRPLLTEPDWVNKVKAGDFAGIRDWYPEAAAEIYP